MAYHYHDEHIVKSLASNTIFVFGSDLAGKHEDGAAKIAHQYFGAVEGIGCGWAGQSFAIPTLDAELRPLSCHDISLYINDFKIYTKNHLSTTYFITALGCGLAGHHVSKIAPFFKGISNNVILPWSFQPFLEENLDALYPPLNKDFINTLFLNIEKTTLKSIYLDDKYTQLAETILNEKYFPTDRYGRNRTYEIEDITYHLKHKIPQLYNSHDDILISSVVLSLIEIYKINEKDFYDLWQGKLSIKYTLP